MHMPSSFAYMEKRFSSPQKRREWCGGEFYSLKTLATLRFSCSSYSSNFVYVASAILPLIMVVKSRDAECDALRWNLSVCAKDVARIFIAYLTFRAQFECCNYETRYENKTEMIFIRKIVEYAFRGWWFLSWLSWWRCRCKFYKLTQFI